MTDDDKKTSSPPSGNHEGTEDKEPISATTETGESTELSYERYDDEKQDPWTQSPLINEQKSAETAAHREEKMGEAKSAGGIFPGKGKGKVDLSGEHWDRDILNRLAFATLNEQRRARRWNVFFKALAFIYIGALLFYIPSDLGQKGIAGGKHTAIIEVNGAIGADTEANADNIVGGLRAAFKNKNTAAVILRINSPGGSPVQAGYVYDEIKRLRVKYPNTKLYAVITDICASGGYYIAAAADEIYADKASIVGSIGVLMNGFGFVETMKKLGVERRLVTAGEHKGALDPFSPIKQDELKHVQSLLDGVHKQFINVVKEGRGDRLKDSPNLFSGLFWNGEEGVKLGLVDGLGSSSYVAREIVGAENLVDFTVRASYFDRFAESLGAGFAKMMATTLGINPASIQ
ncbi:S49 family peptidase [Kaarinaea lacus]